MTRSKSWRIWHRGSWTSSRIWQLRSRAKAHDGRRVPAAPSGAAPRRLCAAPLRLLAHKRYAGQIRPPPLRPVARRPWLRWSLRPWRRPGLAPGCAGRSPPAAGRRLPGSACRGRWPARPSAAALAPRRARCGRRCGGCRLAGRSARPGVPGRPGLAAGSLWSPSAAGGLPGPPGRLAAAGPPGQPRRAAAGARPSLVAAVRRAPGSGAPSAGPGRPVRAAPGRLRARLVGGLWRPPCPRSRVKPGCCAALDRDPRRPQPATKGAFAPRGLHNPPGVLWGVDRIRDLC